MDIFLLYLWTRLDSIQGVLIGLVVVGIVTVLVSAIDWSTSYNDEKVKTGKAFSLRIAKYTMIPLLAIVLIPSQKDAAIIAGGWAAKQIATSEGAQQLSSKTFALINGKLDEELAKLQQKEEQK